MVSVAVAALLVFLLPSLLPALRAEPWSWIVIVLQGIYTVALGAYLVWFVRKQRDDYWRERGKDPKHPEL